MLPRLIAAMWLAATLGCHTDQTMMPDGERTRPQYATITGFTLTDITPTGARAAVASAVSDRGWTAGVADDATGSFAWVRSPSGSYRALGTLPGYPNAWPEAVNNNGDAVGSVFANGNSIAVFWPANSPPVRIFVPGLYPIRAWSLNDHQEVVGTALTSLSPPFAFHAIVWTYQHQQGTDLGTLGGVNADATDINATGDIAGWVELPGNTTRAFIKPTGQNAQQLVYGANASAVAVGVNDLGVAMTAESGAGGLTGIEWTTGYTISEKWMAQGGILDLNRNATALTFNNGQPAVHVSHGTFVAIPGLPSGSATFVYELNGSEWVVGQARNRLGQDRAILWRPY